MAGFNRVILVGNLTRDPEYKQLASGQAVCRLGLAMNRQFKNKQTGNMVQEVCYIDIDVWGPQAESCRQYLKKGRPVLIEGRLKLDSWEDQQGQTRSKHMIVADRVMFLGSGAQAEETDDMSAGDSMQEQVQLNPNNPVERDLMNQLEKAKERIHAASKSPEQKPESPATGEINFRDEAPFEDELPF